MLAAAPPPFVQSRPVLRAALEWAAQLHASQLRDVDQAPFILHPLEVAALLASRGFDEEVVAAGLLHDVVENSEADVDEVRGRFGDRIADAVSAVSEDPAIAEYDARKAALRAQVAAAGPDTHAVYAADKITKARELRAQAAHAESSLEDPALRRRLEHYEESLATLREVAGGLSIVEALAFELWALRALPPA
jgi:(p)ppGpp synthase/HD superfamily hydrolase